MPTGEFSSLQNTFQRKTVRETIYNINYDPPNRLKKEPTKSSFFMGEKKLERSHLKSFFFIKKSSKFTLIEEVGMPVGSWLVVKRRMKAVWNIILMLRRY